MNDKKIEEIKSALREVVQLLAQRGQPLSPEMKAMLTQVMEHAGTRITQLRNEPAVTDVQSPVPQGAELLWILSGQQISPFVNYLRTYPGEGFKELASNPSQLASVIQQLQQSNPQEEVGQDNLGIPNTELPSSNVAGMKYNPRDGKLFVKFHGERSEPIYQYDAVPPQIFQLLKHGNAFAQTKGKNRWGEWWPMKNPSIGASVNQYLKKGGYAYHKIR